jgi:HAD superfamily hydrolase (TIGR01509 family)
MKAFIFDLDGVLVDTCDLHYIALNKAITEVVGPDVAISQKDHETKFNGLSTRMKLDKLPLTREQCEKIYTRKQELTMEAFSTLLPSGRLQEMIAGLRARGYSIGCASNCIRSTVHMVLMRLGIHSLFDVILSNEDVANPKPSPEIYTLAMERLGVIPSDTLIFEDSYVGLRAARSSGAHVHCVSNPVVLTLEYCLSAKPNLTKHVNIVIPMAGNGSRFASVGYKQPKPLIPVFGKPMISWVVNNLGLDATYTFITRKEFGAEGYLKSLVPDCNIVTIDRVTEGAACTVLLAKEYISNDPLLIINSDQYIEFEDCNTAFKFVFDFLYNPSEQKFAGKISTFDGGGHPKWSYAKIDETGIVTEVREKDPFSPHATTGLYLWRHGTDFVRYANQMIAKNIRVNNEFYVVPVFNEAIQDGKLFEICDCKRMWGIGTPEDLEVFLNNKNVHTCLPLNPCEE